jgi:hypothetical protein
MSRRLVGLIGVCGLVFVWSGAWAWQTTINGTANDADGAIAVTVDSTGDVVAVGQTKNASTGFDFTVVKLGGAAGAERWRYVLLNGTADDFDAALAVVVDGAGDVVVAGYTTNAGTGTDFLVVKLHGGTGAERWRYLLNGTANGDDAAAAVTVDSAGNTVVAGHTTNTGTGPDCTVVKLDGASGAESWRYVLSGAFSDAAVAVTVDGAGDVVAAGSTANGADPRAFLDLLVVKLDGASGANRANTDSVG